MGDRGMTRREMVRRTIGAGTALAAPGLLGSSTSVGAAAHVADTTSSTGLRVGSDLYQSIGVRPLINARGTYTIISGSLMLPEVREAMAEASKHYVHLDELTEAVGARLAALTGAEWGLVSSGCAAALTHATAACVAGGNPDLHVRIPNLTGFQRDEVIIPKHSRNVYDAALRAVGVRVAEVSTMAELDAAFGPRTALVYILAGPNADASPISLEAIAPHAKERGVPILVDAAAEILTIPNVHLQKGATLVAYSGGKCLRGPQAAGLLLGRKDLVRAAWVHSAPHHGFARGKKVGKEEAIAMLMAVEMWVKRDHEGEWARWSGWLDTIAQRVKGIDGIQTSVVQPEGLSNKTPSLRVLWDRKQLGASGEAVARTLLDGEPRIALFPARADDPAMTGVSITPYMLVPGDEKIIADRLHRVLSSPPKDTMSAPAAPSTDIGGRWDVRIDYAASQSHHTLQLLQRGNDVTGTHQGDFVSRDIAGTIDGSTVKLHSAYDEEHGDALHFSFTGTVTGDEIAGTLDMGEYLSANWTAKRHVAERS
jgi:seryl-tRNA(Sec) selenium transferase